MIVSSFAQVSLEDTVRAAPSAKLWMQLYLFKDRRNTENLVRRAEKLGVKALVVTVDSPCFGMCDRGFTDKASTVPDFTLPKR
ncbi:Hydroxyacid oxidase 1 [Holothuria leucospilota]|uniref:Hydroxyacid oxidase 1 n=1 Tax=Holothuria leucospilota TaxID=206669 RepID=A0A9Q1HBK6_HOLLE|nr:Hydroxyacid oxidase 1 [Holothuria leucospilota]